MHDSTRYVVAQPSREQNRNREASDADILAGTDDTRVVVQRVDGKVREEDEEHDVRCAAPWMCIGKFTLGATFSLGRDTLAPGNCAGQQPGEGVACHAWSAMLQYNSTSWGAGVAYNEQRGGETSSVTLIPSRPTIPFRSSSDKDSRFLVDGYANFGDVKLGAGWIYRRLRADAVSLQTNLFFAGATYTVTPSVVLDGQYVGLRSTVDGVSGDLAIARVTYLLSKRSAVYVAGAHMFNGHASTFSVSSTSPVPAAPVAGRGQTGVMIGVRELF